MTNHHFLSYSTHDGAEFALKLCDALAAGPPAYPVWLDQRELKPGQDWDTQLVEAIRTCASLLFVMTHDSVEDRSVCKQEWTRALKYKKPIVPLRLHAGAELPFRLEPRQFIDFSGDFDAALAQLRRHLHWLTTPAGHLQALNDRLADAQRDLRRAQEPTQRQRIEAEIAELQAQIARQEQIVADPQAAAARVQQSIERGLERERQPERPLRGEARTKFIHPPPAIAPAYFQDRHVETRLIGDFLRDEARRLLAVVGRGGVGKTAMVCRVLKALERGHLPDDGGPLAVDGILYLSETGSHRVNAPNLLAGLCQLLPPALAERLDAFTRDPKVATAHKMTALLEQFRHQPVVVLLDNLETLVDSETRALTDADLDEALRALLAAPPHRAKLILTTRLAPRALALHHPERQMPLNLDEGLASPYAENILRALDADGTLGLQRAPEPLLTQARERTRGYPRALEALFAILAADRESTLADLLAAPLPDNVVQALVGEAFSRLDPPAQLVMQALAIYARPVSPVAVDYLLQPYLPGLESGPVLGRLVNMHFARHEERRYYLHPADQEYALARLPAAPPDGADDDSQAPSQLTLRRRAADYFRQARLPRSAWRTLADLEPQLAEFDLRCAAQEYETAADVLREIDFDYLLLWGHARLLVELHRQLLGNLRDPRLAAGSLGNLGLAYADLGQVEQAISHYQQALAIAREIGDRRGEGNRLGNLGNAYADLGQVEQSTQYIELALVNARGIGDKYGECIDSINMADLLVAQARFGDAIEWYRRAIQLADEIGSAQGQCEARLGQAIAHLLAGELPAAAAAARAASAVDYPSANHRVRAVLGVIALCQGDLAAARVAFDEAVAAAGSLLAHTPHLYAAQESKGLALCGLALLAEQPDLTAAVEAYRAARAATTAPGIVGRALRLFDALAVADEAGVLAPVRPVVAGETSL